MKIGQAFAYTANHEIDPAKRTVVFIHGVLKYGVLSGRSQYVDWAHAAFENVRALGTDFGFFPHRTSGPDRWREAGR